MRQLRVDRTPNAEFLEDEPRRFRPSSGSARVDSVLGALRTVILEKGAAPMVEHASGAA